MKKSMYALAGVIAVILIGVGTYMSIDVDKKENDKDKVEEKVENKDAIKFASEYTQVGEDNVFVYRNSDEIIKILKNGTGVVYLGFPECQWCQAYVPMLNEVAKETGIEKIYYYNILQDRKDNTKVYKEIVSILDKELQYDDEGNRRIYVPNVSFHIDGKIIGNDYETSLDTHDLDDPKDYWTEKEQKELKDKLKKYMKKVKEATSVCTKCNAE